MGFVHFDFPFEAYHLTEIGIYIPLRPGRGIGKGLLGHRGEIPITTGEIKVEKAE